MRLRKSHPITTMQQVIVQNGHCTLRCFCTCRQLRERERESRWRRRRHTDGCGEVEDGVLIIYLGYLGGVAGRMGGGLAKSDEVKQRGTQRTRNKIKPGRGEGAEKE